MSLVGSRVMVRNQSSAFFGLKGFVQSQNTPHFCKVVFDKPWEGIPSSLFCRQEIQALAFYTYEDDIKGKTANEIADLILNWRNDDDQMGEAGFDLLNAIERWLRNPITNSLVGALNSSLPKCADCENHATHQYAGVLRCGECHARHIF